MGGTQVEALDSLKQKEEVCYPLNVPGVVKPHPTFGNAGTWVFSK